MNLPLIQKPLKRLAYANRFSWSMVEHSPCVPLRCLVLVSLQTKKRHSDLQEYSVVYE